MRRGLTAATVLVAASILATPAHAIESTADLRDACAAEDEASRNFCLGYIKGAGHLYIELIRADVIPQIACADPVPTMEEIRLSVVTWIDAHPEHASDRAVDGLMQASAAIWPCD